MPKEEKKPSSSISPIALIAGVLVILAVITFAFLQRKESQENSPAKDPTATAPLQAPAQTESVPGRQQATSQNFPMPPFHESAEAVTLPPTKDPGTVAPAAQAAYLVAQQKPKLLAQLPCFCYCDKFGHTSLHDCCVSDHAENCDICMKEALQADQLDKEGIPANQIRDMIVAQFHPRDHTH
jgi:Protein of unknown function with PCYCGC motif